MSQTWKCTVFVLPPHFDPCYASFPLFSPIFASSSYTFPSPRITVATSIDRDRSRYGRAYTDTSNALSHYALDILLLIKSSDQIFFVANIFKLLIIKYIKLLLNVICVLKLRVNYNCLRTKVYVLNVFSNKSFVLQHYAALLLQHYR